MPMTTRKDAHDARQQREHAEALKRKAERRGAHERRMKQQAEDAARAKAERARRHKELKDEEARRRTEKEARRGWGSPSSSGSSYSSWPDDDYNAYYSYYQPNPAFTANLEREKERAAVTRYEAGWERMKRQGAEGQLHFADIPWPTIRPVAALHDLTRANIESFVFSEALIPAKDRRARIRALMLQWHPDKFIGKWMQYVCEPDRAIVQEGITLVATFANELLASLKN